MSNIKMKCNGCEKEFVGPFFISEIDGYCMDCKSTYVKFFEWKINAQIENTKKFDATVNKKKLAMFAASKKTLSGNTEKKDGLDSLKEK